MGLFKRRQPQTAAEPAVGGRTREPPGFAAAALARGLRPVAEVPFESGLADRVHRMSWSLYGREYSSVYDVTSYKERTVYHDSYAGLVGDRRVVVSNAWTNIGPQHVVKLLEMVGVAVCAVEVGSVAPFLLAQPNDLPRPRNLRPAPTGHAALDERLLVVPTPGLGAEVLTGDVQRRLLAHDDWAFAGTETWLACLSRGPFRSGADLEHRLDEVLGLLAAFPARFVPRYLDRSVDDLTARIDAIASLEDALRFLQELTPGDRERLSRSQTPLALFADVSTPEQAMARFQALDVPQRMQLMAMFQRVQGG